MTTATPYEIPLQPTPQKFTISLAGITYTLTTRWNTFASCWMLSIGDQFGNDLTDNIPMLPGRNLLQQYAYLEIGGILIVQSDYDAEELPTYENLGITSHLYYIVLS